jgi:hypothetical protein
MQMSGASSKEKISNGEMPLLIRKKRLATGALFEAF